jgi:hypothetical protein
VTARRTAHPGGKRRSPQRPAGGDLRRRTFVAGYRLSGDPTGTVSTRRDLLE